MHKMTNDYTNNEVLLSEIKLGNNQAFEYLFKSYFPRLRGYASRFINDDEVVRDILQECFLKFWEKRNLIKSISITSLLFVIVRNACLNYLKRQRLVDMLPIEKITEDGNEELYTWDFDISPEKKYLFQELQQQIMIALDKLPARCREVFEMSRFRQMKNREIAEELQISTTAVEKHISKALKILSLHFKKKYPFDIYIVIIAFIVRNM